MADDARRNVRNLPTEACGSRIDDEVERACGELTKTYTRNRTQILKILGERAGALRRAICNDQFGRLQRQQRDEGAACGAACSDHQDATVCDDDTEVVAQVVHQPCTIGVVAQQVSTGLRGEGVDGAGTSGARGKLVGHLDGRNLMRQRDVQSASAGGKECQYPRAEIIGEDVVEPVGDGLSRLLCKHAMDER